MTASDLAAEFARAKARMDKARHTCGSSVVLAYTPGATIVWCHRCAKVVDSLPDWQPIEMADLWEPE